jgi:outer membrane murein-binding lipoprotein Lpp
MSKSNNPVLAAIERLESKLDTARGDIMARIDRLQHTVDQTRDDIIVNFATTDRVERTARGAVDDVLTTTEIMRVMQPQIMRLQSDVEQLKDAS